LTTSVGRQLAIDYNLLICVSISVWLFKLVISVHNNKNQWFGLSQSDVSSY